MMKTESIFRMKCLRYMGSYNFKRCTLIVSLRYKNSATGICSSSCWL